MKKYLIITGGSRGIGKATIARFMHSEWQAVNLSRSPCNLPNVINIHFDLSDAEAVPQCASALIAACQDADKICLVHNAAYLKQDSVDAMSLQILDETLKMNVVAPQRLNALCLPFMKAGSSIIYIGSALSETAVPGCASYIISKHAVIGLMRATCQDLAGRGITTVCICPGLVDTQLLKESMDAKTIDWIVQHKVMAKRLIAPEEIAEVIYTCAMQPIINGEVIHANLGLVGN